MLDIERIRIVQDHLLVSISEPSNQVIPNETAQSANIKFGYVLRNPLLEKVALEADLDDFGHDPMKNIKVGDSVYFLNSTGVIPINTERKSTHLVPMSYVIFGIDNQ